MSYSLLDSLGSFMLSFGSSGHCLNTGKSQDFQGKKKLPHLEDQQKMKMSKKFKSDEAS